MNPTNSRRDLLKVSAAAAMGAGALALAADSAPTAKPRWPMRKAFYGKVAGASLLEQFKLLKEAGFDGAEINAPQHDVNDVREACKQTGIAIDCVVHASHWRQPLSDPSPSIREASLKVLMQALRDAKAIGAGSVLLVPGVVNEKISYDECYKRSQEEIRKAVPLAMELGVKIAIEDVWNNFHLSPLEAARYVDEFESSAVGWHFDIGNVINYGWPEQWIRILGKRIVRIHVKEYSKQKADKEGKWAGFKVDLLEGSNNWPLIMKALDEIGYTAPGSWACIEMPGGDLSRLKSLSGALDKILAM